MCGIVGAIRLKDKDRIEERDRLFFLQLLQTGIVRGWDGTGFMAFPEDGISKTIKVAGAPYNLFSNKAFVDLWEELKKTPTKAMIGHNRAATKGEKTSKHAHPFVFKNISMVHNGTLMSTSKLPKFDSFAVDSEALAYGISELGIEEALKKTNGAYAIVYFDGKDKTINMIRNSERPLHLCMDKWQSRILIASEKKHLEWITDRNNLTGHDVKILELPINTLWTFDSDKNYFEPREKKMYGQFASGGSYSECASGGRVWDTATHSWKERGAQSNLIDGNDIGDEFLNSLPAASKMNVMKALAAVCGARSALSTIQNSAASATKQASLLVPAPAETVREREFRRNPRLREIYVDTKKYTHHGELEFVIKDKVKETESTYFVRKGDKIVCRIVDHVLEEETKKKFAIIAESDDFPNARIHFHCTGENTLDAFFEAMAIEVEVCVFYVPMPGNENSDGETIIWAKSPTIVTAPAQTTLH